MVKIEGFPKLIAAGGYATGVVDDDVGGREVRHNPVSQPHTLAPAAASLFLTDGGRGGVQPWPNLQAPPPG